jgi:hypothetical protein
VSPRAIACASARSCVAVARSPADCSSHFSTAVLVVSHFPPRQIPPLEEIVDGIGRDGEQLHRQVNIQDLWEAGSRPPQVG